MSNLFYDKFYLFVLLTLFVYLPLETIMHGIKINILPPSYVFLFIFSALALLHLFISIHKHHFSFLFHGSLSFITTLLILVIIFLSRFLGELDYIDPIDLNIHIAYFLSYCILGFFLALHIHTIAKEIEKHRNIVTYIFIFFLIVYFALLLNNNDYNLSASLLGFTNKIKNAGIHLTTSSIIALFFLWQISQSKYAALIYFIIGFITLFTLGSRSALAFYIIVSFIMIYRLYSLQKYFILLFVLSSVLFFNLDTIVSFLEQRERMHSLFTLNLKDASLVERQLQITNNLLSIKENLFIGQVMGEILVDKKGSYIHSYVSYLQSYGIVVFTLLNLLILKTSYHLLKRINSNDRFFQFMSMAFLFTILEFIFSRSYITYHLFTFLIVFEVYFYQYDRYKSVSFYKEQSDE